MITPNVRLYGLGIFHDWHGNTQISAENNENHHGSAIGQATVPGFQRHHGILISAGVKEP